VVPLVVSRTGCFANWSFVQLETWSTGETTRSSAGAFQTGRFDNVQFCGWFCRLVHLTGSATAENVLEACFETRCNCFSVWRKPAEQPALNLLERPAGKTGKLTGKLLQQLAVL
jgi:hypothetical protein